MGTSKRVGNGTIYVSVSDEMPEKANEPMRQLKVGGVSTSSLEINDLMLDPGVYTEINHFPSNAGYINCHTNRNKNETETTVMLYNSICVNRNRGIICVEAGTGIAGTEITEVIRAVRDVHMFLSRHMEATHVIYDVSALIINQLGCNRDEQPYS